MQNFWTGFTHCVQKRNHLYKHKKMKQKKPNHNVPSVIFNEICIKEGLLAKYTIIIQNIQDMYNMEIYLNYSMISLSFDERKLSCSCTRQRKICMLCWLILYFYNTT